MSSIEWLHVSLPLRMSQQVIVRFSGASGEVECHDSSGSGAQALRSETEPSQHTPPTKDTDFSFSTKESKFGNGYRSSLKLK